MSAKEFEAALFELVYSKYNTADLLTTLISLEQDVDNLIFSQLDLDTISSYLHKIYTVQDTGIRSCILRICSNIELFSPETITKKYHFDYLIAQSLDQRTQIQKIDDEKYSSFRYISLLLRYRKELPTSILRGLVSLYQKQGNTFKSLIVGYLGEAILICDNIKEIPEIFQILVSYLSEYGCQHMSSLIAYGIEKQLPIIKDNCFLLPLLSPISQLKPSDKLESSCKALSYLLRTWPGLLSFGLQNDAIHDLVMCIPHETDAVIKIFRDLLKIGGNTTSITDGFSGLCLSALIRLGFIEKLNQIASTKTTAASFLNELLPCTSHSGVFGVDLAPHSFNTTISSTNVPNSLLFDLSQALGSSHQLTTVVGFTLPSDTKLWDWSQILVLLTVVLPHNDAEAQSASAKQLYSRLFQFFSGTFLSTSPGKCATMIEPLFALIKLLMQKGWGVPIIESNTSFKQAMLQTLTSLQGNNPIDNSSPQWALLCCVTSLLSDGNGISILSRWGFHQVLQSLGSKCTNISLCKTVLGLLKLYPEADLAIPVFWTFLSSPSNEIHKIAIEELRRKRQTTPNFLLSGFRGLLMPHIKELTVNNALDKLPLAINLLGEIITTDDQALLTIATDKQMHDVLRQHSHIMYSLLLSKKVAFSIYPIDDEIHWWMETGNVKYLEVYDRAVECTFEGNLSVSFTHQPSIIDVNGCTKAPPHIFGQVSQTSTGIEKLTPKIPILLERIKSKSLKQQRAAFFALGHFASVPETIEIVKENDIAEKLFESALSSPSYVLKGTLIASLSLFAQSTYLSSVLQKHNWELFKFGQHQCVIPCDPFHSFEPPAKLTLNLTPFEDIKGYNDITTLLKQMANSLLSKNARTKLTEIYRTRGKELEKNDLALYAHSLMSSFNFAPESREFISYLFKQTPLMPMMKKEYDKQLIDQVRAKINELLSGKSVRSFSEIRTLNNKQK
ncbi:putative cytosolic regulator pianissimo [Histomonas meleagridis]|uniref:putative cytosolic regulator pianissimo n=1 Tax=Histomonas meleagridis TaxID=135588 RepID=UPI00355A1DC9|nr:putative cytosolic regulator pianissimo [Histomonas meleagridis]KAH0798618.1 putative cytosolic regulator pianissimo [Histomonas meleagridis]